MESMLTGALGRAWKGSANPDVCRVAWNVGTADGRLLRVSRVEPIIGVGSFGERLKSDQEEDSAQDPGGSPLLEDEEEPPVEVDFKIEFELEIWRLGGKYGRSWRAPVDTRGMATPTGPSRSCPGRGVGIRYPLAGGLSSSR